MTLYSNSELDILFQVFLLVVFTNKLIVNYGFIGLILITSKNYIEFVKYAPISEHTICPPYL